MFWKKEQKNLQFYRTFRSLSSIKMLKKLQRIPKPIINAAINHMAMESWIHFGDLKTRSEVIKPLINELVDQLGERLDERAESLWSKFKNSINYLRRQLSSHTCQHSTKKKGKNILPFFWTNNSDWEGKEFWKFLGWVVWEPPRKFSRNFQLLRMYF